MSVRRLGELAVGESGTITRVRTAGDGAEGTSGDIGRRLLEMGFLEGARVELAFAAPFGGDPIAVRVRGALIALRRAEALLVEVTS